MGKLSARTVATAKPGRHGDGAGLWLVAAPSGAKKWVFRFTRDGRVTEAGLGSASTVTLAQAREKAQAARLEVAAGINPIAVKKAASAVAKAPKTPTFGAVADMVFAAKSPSWRSACHTVQWRSSLATHAAALQNIPIDQIDDIAVRSALIPIWLTVPETASRVRGRCEEIWDFAKVHGWVHGENPFRWKGNLQHVLPRRPKIEQRHLAAMDYRQIPQFLKDLRAEETAARLCLEFLVLTASRSAEAREAMWSEVDLKSAIWTLPPERMKAGQSHRVPLPTRAIAILEIMQARRTVGDFVFPSAVKPSRPVSEYPLHKLLPPGVTLHGMRSAFRDFCAEQTHYPREICEEALAHTVGSVVERAYRRTDVLERRRELMEAWAQHCSGSAVENVVPIAAGKR
jgi:integrase